MYGKIFAKMFTGSMAGSGAVPIAVMSYAIAHQQPPDFTVELNSKYLSMVIGESQDKIETAIEFLSSPDPTSRTEGHDGKRLIKVGPFMYHMVNGKNYHEIRNYEERKEYNRQAQAKYREKMKKLGIEIPDTTGSETESESETEAAETNGTKRFKAPTLDEVIARCKEIGLPESKAAEFINFYGSKGWKVGTSPMKNWQMALTGWKTNWLKTNPQPVIPPTSPNGIPVPKKKATEDHYIVPGWPQIKWDMKRLPARTDFPPDKEYDDTFYSFNIMYGNWRKEYIHSIGKPPEKPEKRVAIPKDIAALIPNKNVASQIADPNSPEEIEAALLRGDA